MKHGIGCIGSPEVAARSTFLYEIREREITLELWAIA